VESAAYRHVSTPRHVRPVLLSRAWPTHRLSRSLGLSCVGHHQISVVIPRQALPRVAMCFVAWIRYFWPGLGISRRHASDVTASPAVELRAIGKHGEALPGRSAFVSAPASSSSYRRRAPPAPPVRPQSPSRLSAKVYAPVSSQSPMPNPPPGQARAEGRWSRNRPSADSGQEYVF